MKVANLLGKSSSNISRSSRQYGWPFLLIAYINAVFDVKFNPGFEMIGFADVKGVRQIISARICECKHHQFLLH
jgi:hypothetical protein